MVPRSEADPKTILVHDPADEDPSTAFALSRLSTQDLSTTVTGVFRSVSRPAYDDDVRDQAALAREARPPSIGEVIAGPETWNVPERSES